jgi:RNA polymerase sigma-70 factor (ECF subfamily)
MLTIAASSAQRVVDRCPPEPASLRSISDPALIEAIAAGDRQAMKLLFVRHNVRVYRFILRLIGDAALAEDLVSDVFLDVWRRADAFEGKSQVSTWLLSIARNKAFSTVRRRCREQLDEHGVAAEIEDPGDSPETIVHCGQRASLVRKLLTQLSPSHREVIDLVYYHDKTVDEVAQIAGVSTGTVKTRMFYARRRLQSLLAAAGCTRL